MASFLITGAARGLGLALTKELLTRSEVGKIIAAARKPSPELEAVAKGASGRVSIVLLDVINETSIKAIVPTVEKELGGKGLDVLINNAGIAHWAFEGTKTMQSLEESMQVNVLGVHWVTRNFLPLLQQGNLKKVVNISTTLGSMTLMPSFTSMPCPAYKISKAALNALTVNYALDFANDGFSFMALTPGWLKTDLGGGNMADLTPEQGAKASVDVIFRPNKETNGQLANIFVEGFENGQGPSVHVYDGKNVPW